MVVELVEEEEEEAEVEVVLKVQTSMVVSAGMEAIVAIVVTVEAVVCEAGHQQLQRARRDDCVLWTDDECACSSWDRCGRYMAVRPAPRLADQ